MIEEDKGFEKVNHHEIITHTLS